jgi:hypothetical protein
MQSARSNFRSLGGAVSQPRAPATMIGTFVGVPIIASVGPGIIAIGLAGFDTQFMYGLLITISGAIYAPMLRRQD